MNWESDNVWGWIDNDECLYNAMIEYAQKAHEPTYKGFIAWMGLEGQKTPDGVQWDDSRLDYDELDEMFVQDDGDLTPLERLAYTIHGAEYCYFDDRNNTLIAWNGSLTFNVISLETGETVALWTSIDDMDVTQARRKILYAISRQFAHDNEGMTYLEAYAV